ncbi:MAG: helix-turn-helix transcriptional regulator [Acidobacteriota bacterium]
MEAFANTAALLGDPARAAMLLSLMGGVALPAGELAHIANIAPQTASGHLAKLLEGRLLSVELQGRHRYYRLASPRVADALESLLVLTHRPQPRSAPQPTVAKPGTLAYARTCYAHTAGWIGVQIVASLQQQSLLKPTAARTFKITPAGQAWFEALGIDLPSTPRAREASARRCLDWTERKHHLAGPLGCALYRRLRELEWLAPMRDTRALRVTLRGKRGLWDSLRIPIE